MKIRIELVKELIKQINNHSGNICNLIAELKSTYGSVGSPANKRESELKEEIAVQNECIQDVLVSFHDLFIEGKLKVFELAIRKWGVKPQWTMLKEECAELIVEICKMDRLPDNTQRVAEELSDVEIMVNQAKLMLGLEYYSEVYNKTYEKLCKKISEIE